jgi:hypothetical protein
MMLDHKLNPMNNLRCSNRRVLAGDVSNLAQATTEVSGKSEPKLLCTERLDILVIERLRVAS